MKQYYLNFRVTYELDHFEKWKIFETSCPLSRTFSNVLYSEDDDILILENEEEVDKVLKDLNHDLTIIQNILHPLTPKENVFEKMPPLYDKYCKDSFMTLLILQHRLFEISIVNNTLKIHFIGTDLYWIIEPKIKYA